ncbi:MAG TPA: sialidase family protein, partial [Longimicrobiales bacterium]|nr:sialidase family protein [Longimicrobiales bacterium]
GPGMGSGMHHHGASDPDDPGSDIRFAASTDGGRSFSASRVVDRNACPCCRTVLATGADGSVYVAWRKVYPGNVRDVVVARKAPGAADFGAPVRVSADGWVFPGCPHAGPALAVDGRGRVHVGWYTGAEKHQGLWYAVSTDQGRSWSAPVALETAAWVPPSQVKLAAAGDDVWVAWDDRRKDPRTVTIARAAGTGALQVVAEAATGASPALAASGDGALVAWLDGQAVRARAVGGGRARR